MILVDTDVSLGTPGAEIDDGAALIMLLSALPNAICGVSIVHGNVPLRHAISNTGRLLSFLDRADIPLMAGAARPLKTDPSWLDFWYSRYGETPEWKGKLHPKIAADGIIETVRQNPDEVTLIALGPLTNLALALQKAPDIEGKVEKVIAMGGSFGGAKPEPEFNFRCDPEAAAIVMRGTWSLTLLGLNITRKILFSRQDFERLPDNNPALRLLKKQAIPWIDTVEEQGWETGGCSLHDAVAVAALLDESLFEFIPAQVSIELDDPDKRGLAYISAVSEDRSNLRVAASVDIRRCYELVSKFLK